MDENWYVGKLLEVPGVFSQGETLEELKENIKEAYQLMIDDYNESTQFQPNSNSLELVI
jgi:predicted RNase H-like HicB family nuclease